MNVKKSIIAIVVLLLADLAWINLYMNKQYEVQVRDIQNSDLKLDTSMALFAYILMIVGLLVFVLPNIRSGHELEDSLKYGFTFGIVLYGVYDFTAGAIFTKWNKKLAVTDILWGGFVYFIATYTASKLG
jgi:uncharacterized membrane protein